MYFRWNRPPPLTDCCRPPTRLERIVWWIKCKVYRLTHKRKTFEFRYVVIPKMPKPFPKLDPSMFDGSFKGEDN